MSETLDIIELLVRKKSKNEYSLAFGYCNRQLSPRPKSLISGFIVSVDCQACLLIEILSTDGSITPDSLLLF